MASERSKTLKRVISVCEKKDINAWRIASDRITRYIKSDSYQLICPESQVEDFKSASSSGWSVVGEELYSSGCEPVYIRGRVSGHNTSRVNWLFQQFIKINAIVGSELADDDAVLIWDADTIPLREIDFFDSGRLSCFHGPEHHRPYFETIEKLFGFGRMADQSFIAQCLPVRVGWVREMVGEIETRFAKPYVDAVLNLLPGNSGSEFSEYETIGSWVLVHYPDGMTFKKKKRWLRSGARIFGPAPSELRIGLGSWILSICYDFVALENWSRPLNWARLRGFFARRVFGRVLARNGGAPSEGPE